MEVQIPKLRSGSFFPSLLERRRRIDKALHAVILEAYVHGVSTRNVDDLVAALGVDSGISKSEVSRICGGLDTEIARSRERTLTQGRGLSGVHLVISDAHAGLKAAATQKFSGAAWQRCRVHFMRNLHGKVSAKQIPPVMAAVKTIFAHTEPEAVHEQWDQVADTLEAAYPKVAAMMREAKADVLAFTAFPTAHWQKIWSNNPIERPQQGNQTPR